MNIFGWMFVAVVIFAVVMICRSIAAPDVQRRHIDTCTELTGPSDYDGCSGYGIYPIKSPRNQFVFQKDRDDFEAKERARLSATTEMDKPTYRNRAEEAQAGYNERQVDAAMRRADGMADITVKGGAWDRYTNGRTK